jgi:hypothetical protein
VPFFPLESPLGFLHLSLRFQQLTQKIVEEEALRIEAPAEGVEGLQPLAASPPFALITSVRAQA